MPASVRLQLCFGFSFGVRFFGHLHCVKWITVAIVCCHAAKDALLSNEEVPAATNIPPTGAGASVSCQIVD